MTFLRDSSVGSFILFYYIYVTLFYGKSLEVKQNLYKRMSLHHLTGHMAVVV